MNAQYKRVSRHRTCLICGKPDWCSYTPDAKISFCARITTGADRVSRTGWGVFYHEKSLFSRSTLSFPVKPLPKKTELAPIEIRDYVYRKLIALSPATRFPEIIDGPQGLRSRKILDFENYGSLPRSRAEREDIAKQIRVSINREFPDFVRKRKSSVTGLPGFWLDKTGRIQLWSEKDYSCPMMLIPYRAPNGLIQACQIRFMPLASSMVRCVRYVWLSVSEKMGGTSCGSPLHFASYSSLKSKPILITEGALKAETVQKFRTGCDVLANAGANCSHEEIVAATRFRHLYIAFDADFYENPHIARSIARLLNSVLEESAVMKFNPRIYILTWNLKFKGIDDALLQNSSIIPVTPSKWIFSLSESCQREIKSSFRFVT